MNRPRDYWPRWTETLRRHQLNDIVASLLEAGGPLTFLSAQLLHAARSFTNNNDQLAALAATLEKDDETRAFASYLTGEIDK